MEAWPRPSIYSICAMEDHLGLQPSRFNQANLAGCLSTSRSWMSAMDTVSRFAFMAHAVSPTTKVLIVYCSSSDFFTARAGFR